MTEGLRSLVPLRTRRLHPGRPRAVVVDGYLPTRRQLARVARKGYGVHVLTMPPGVRDLSFLLPLGPALTQLTVTDWSCTDVRAVEELTGLAHLDLWTGSRHAVDLGRLPLASFAGRWHEGLGSVLGRPSLVHLTLEAPPRDVLSRIPLGLREVRLSAIRGGSCRLDDLPRSSRLERIELAALREVDLSGTEELGALRRLDLLGVEVVLGVASLSAVPTLDRLVLEDCRTVEGLVRGLGGPGLRHVLLSGSTPRHPAVLDLVVERGLEWATPR